MTTKAAGNAAQGVKHADAVYVVFLLVLARANVAQEAVCAAEICRAPIAPQQHAFWHHALCRTAANRFLVATIFHLQKGNWCVTVVSRVRAIWSLDAVEAAHPDLVKMIALLAKLVAAVSSVYAAQSCSLLAMDVASRLAS